MRTGAETAGYERNAGVMRSFRISRIRAFVDSNALEDIRVFGIARVSEDFKDPKAEEREIRNVGRVAGFFENSDAQLLFMNSLGKTYSIRA